MRYRVAVLTVAVSLTAVPDAGAATRLKAFASCKDLVSYARAGARRTGGGVGVVPRAVPIDAGAIVTPPVGPTRDGTVAPQAGSEVGGAAPDFSGTNVQELGVDEPDVVKTDGRRILAVTDRTLRVIDVTGDAPKVIGTLALEGVDQRLLVRGDRVLVIASEGTFAVPPGVGPVVAPEAIRIGAAKTIVTEVDVSDPAAPKVARTMTVDGRFVDARQHGATARLVVDAAPPVVEPDGGVRSFLGRTVLRSRISGRTFRRNLAPCDTVRRPRQFSGLDVLAILTVDLDRGLYSLDRDGVMAGAQVVYGSADSLYVASRRYVRALEQGTAVPDSVTTEIHRFDISDPEHTVYRATGSVPGFILNSYALSEYRGDLRVASTEEPPWQPGGSPGSSTVTVLRQDGAQLAPIGSLRGLGQGQQIYAVRFMGDKGFVVTFRQVDPLHALDLSDPTAPKLRGELEIPGYSSYLHPISDTLLLGIGRDGPNVQASLFDVSNLAAPKRVSLLDFGAGASAVESEPHAFLYWPATGLAVLPLQTGSFTGSVALNAKGPPLTEAGRIAHTVSAHTADIERALVVGDKLYTLSYLGLAAGRLDTLATTGFTAF
jgi:hypothetical protein